MRIIAGRHRGRRLAAPEGMGTRPMTDRVRENLFNLLTGRVAGGVVLDLFAGSGALGLEALSRGAAWCTFVERAGPAAKTLRSNLSVLGLEDRARLERRDALDPGPWIRPPGAERYTLLFADPPYRMTTDPQGRQNLARMAGRMAELDVLAPGAAAMLRTQRGTPIEDAPWPGFETEDARTYGTTTLHLMKYHAAAQDIRAGAG
jgi:16S rRNA (guanine966-N2)-methyltransferase